jgi:hypothetical protein
MSVTNATRYSYFNSLFTTCFGHIIWNKWYIDATGCLNSTIQKDHIIIYIHTNICVTAHDKTHICNYGQTKHKRDFLKMNGTTSSCVTIPPNGATPASFKATEPIYHSTEHHNPADSILHSICCENLLSHSIISFKHLHY